MCPSDLAHDNPTSMTESSRTRSDSLEASSSQQDRKRPRLDPSHDDNCLQSEEALADPALPETPVNTDSPKENLAGSTFPRNSASSPDSSTMEPSSSGTLSKMTINTRSGVSNQAEALARSPDPSQEVVTSTDAPHSIGTHVEPASTLGMTAPSTDALVSDTGPNRSSPSQSPEIQIALIEDIDQDPAETSWTPVTRLASSRLLQEQARPHHVSRTFPYCHQASAGFMHELLIEMARIFLQGGERDGYVFIEVKDWLINFLELYPRLTARQIYEEKAFWEEFPDLVNSLLRRLIDVPAQARTGDLENFFVAYGLLTIRFLQLDVDLMRQCQALGTPERVTELHSRPYLPTLALVLQYREVPFYTLLHASRGFNVNDLVSPICDRLSSDPDGILPVLTTFLHELSLVLSRKPAFTTIFVQTLAIASALAQSGTERMLMHGGRRPAPSAIIQKINQQILLFCMKADDTLQTAISRQSPWLTIENSPDILRFLSKAFHALSEQDAEISAQLMAHIADNAPEMGRVDLPEIIAYAWKFKTLRKYITAGRMELRVYGMDSMRTDLVDVWKCYAQYNSKSLSVPLVKFLVQFLRENKMVQYIVGVDSHPQLITRSSNVIGFLVVTGTYCNEDSDIIWRTVTESQDPRTVSEVLNMLRSIFPMQSLSTLMYLCRKLLELPIERYDGKMVDYADALLYHVRETAVSQVQHDECLEAVPFKFCVRLIRDVIASQTCSPDQKCRLPTWAADNLSRLLGFNINNDDKAQLWEQCVQDIAQKTAFSTGSMRALQAWLEVRPDVEVPRLTRDFDFTRLLVEELVTGLRQMPVDDSSTDVVEIILPTRLSLLTLVAQHAPDTITEELIEKLWCDILVSQQLEESLKDRTWDVFSKVAAYSTRPNSIIHRLMTDYLPRVQAEKLNECLLYFAENSVLYEMRIMQPCGRDDSTIVSLPGISRVWRFVMECPTGTVENQATAWIIKQYLDHEIILRSPRRVVEATHQSLLKRCLSEVFSAASRLKSYSDGTTSGEDEPMVVVISEEGIKAEELRFARSLLFLREFLQGVKNRPRYSPSMSNEAQLPGKPFRDRGKEVTITYQIVPIPGRSTPTVQKKLLIGDLNTVDELAKYLCDLTGFSQFTGVSLGQKICLIGNQAAIKDSTVSMGNLFVHKVPETPERQVVSYSRQTSTLETHIIDHFDQFYELLDLEEYLSKEVFAFMQLFPPHRRITDLVKERAISATHLFPVAKPYKLLYCLAALQLCIEDEAHGSAPNEAFMAFSVRSVILVLHCSDEIDTDESLRALVNSKLVQCLLSALHAPVALVTSEAYFSNMDSPVSRLLNLAFDAIQKETLNGSRTMQQELLITQILEVLLESALHDARIGLEMSCNDRAEALLHYTLLEDKSAEVRKVIADVILCLISQPSTKLAFPGSLGPKPARDRFSAAKVEDLLNILWKMLMRSLPRTCDYASASQQFFDVSSGLFKVVQKSMASTEVVECFQQWASLLISYDHQEVVGKSKDDFVVSGFASLIQEAYRMMQNLELDVSTGAISLSIFDTFLYPTPASQSTRTAGYRTPLLKDTGREDLYGLVLSLTRVKSVYDRLAERLDGLIVKETLPGFAPHIQSERQALRSEIGYAGLKNLSNTCYLNSLFSQLFMNLEFRQYIFAMDPGGTGKSAQLLRELSKLFASMQNRWNKYIDTTDVVSCIETYDNERIDVSIQMDVDEFFNLLFDRLEGQISKLEDRNAFRSLYGGQLVQQIKSRECDHISERLEPFSAIQCEIKGKMTLEDSLRAYVEGEIMQGDNKYSCTSCNRHVDAIKRACLKDIPDHLIFNLKRFDFDITTMTRCKVNDEFRFPESIDMAPYNVDSLSSSERPLFSDTFELVGILVHSGTAESGHYYSYIRERPSSRFADNSWVQFNDIDVTTFDSRRIADCCFGGVEHASNLQLSKSHSAYMLFYQRSTSIRHFEATYDNHDDSNPVRLPFSTSLSTDIDARNQETIRSYCLQDPSHARFMRLMLVRMQWAMDRQCSDEHEVEDKMIRHSLDYVQQISCRLKEMPEFEAICKLLLEYTQQCSKCAAQTVLFFVDEEVADGHIRRESVIRCAILRNPNALVRRTFASILCETLRTMKKTVKGEVAKQKHARDRELQYHEAYAACVRGLAEPWSDLHKSGRAWNDYFDLLSRLTGFGCWETGVLLQYGFLEKVAEMIWAEVRHDPMDLRVKYASYLNLREKGRFFGFAGLIAFLASLLDYVQITDNCDITELRIPNSKGFYELSPSEARLLRPTRVGQKQKLSLEWVRRVIMTKQNPNAVTKIISSLLNEAVLAGPLEVTLAQGLAAETICNATAFLEPAIRFCKACKNHALVQLFVKEALGGVDSIGGSCGKEHLDFIIELADLENDGAGLTRGDFFTMVFRNMKSWAPTLLMFPDDIHCDVRGDTMRFLEDRLLQPLTRGDLEASQEDMLRRYARSLAKSCVFHIQQNHLPRMGKQVARIEIGQTNHIARVVEYLCQQLFTTGDAADDHFVSEAMTVLEHLQAFTQETVEAASDDWPDNDSVAPSESENGDFQDWNENT